MWRSARVRLPQAGGERPLRLTQGPQRACVRSSLGPSLCHHTPSGTPRTTHIRGSANRLWLAARTTLPTVANPAASDEPSYDDDYLREGHPEVYDSPHPLGAPHQLLMSIVPGVGAFHHPTFRCLKRSPFALIGDHGLQATGL